MKKQSFSTYYRSSDSPRIGDTVATPRFGTCKVLSLNPRKGLFTVRSIMTGEKDFQIISECDLIERKENN